jgi:hypothetical protein
MLDTAMVGVVDLVYVRGSILAATSQVNLVVVVAALVMTLVVSYAIARPRDRYVVGRLSWYGPLLVGLYLVVAYASRTERAGRCCLSLCMINLAEWPL